MVVIDLGGDVNADAEEALTGAYAQAIEANPSNIVLNFTGVAYINSTGVALIGGLLARARREGRDVAACGLSNHYREIFEITRLSDFVRVYEDEDSAIANVS